MRPAFPGMDPWLEHPDLWPDVHNSLITAMRDTLAPLVRPRYFVGVESRTTVLTGLDVDLIYRPDVAIRAVDLAAPKHGPSTAVLELVQAEPVEVIVPIDDEIEETYLAIKDVPGRKLVTVIEVLSPTNKKTKDARTEYLQKRHDWIRSGVSLVEIDLLRAGEPMPLKNPPSPSDYRILICRARQRRNAAVYAFSWRVPIPTIPIPLSPGDPEPRLDVNSVLHALIDRASYDLVIDYRQPPSPPLRPEDQAFAAQILARMAEDAPAQSQQKGIVP
jgi:hypothetical protein